ncbi:MAG: hypothetical protein CMJ32_10420 [Phycisphaerae bacterium]|nr:hypothetical protein [Phycisphaerae bacterium]
MTTAPALVLNNPIVEIDVIEQQGDPMSGCATAMRVGGDQFGAMYELTDLVWSGDRLLARSSEPIEPGSIVSLGFQHAGCMARRATVYGCRFEDGSYRNLLYIDQQMAA